MEMASSEPHAAKSPYLEACPRSAGISTVAPSSISRRPPPTGDFNIVSLPTCVLSAASVTPVMPIEAARGGCAGRSLRGEVSIESSPHQVDATIFPQRRQAGDIVGVLLFKPTELAGDELPLIPLELAGALDQIVLRQRKAVSPDPPHSFEWGRHRRGGRR